MLPYANATLTAIRQPGTDEDYDTPAAQGADRWTGSEGIYVAEEIIETLSPGRVDEVIQTRLEIPYDTGRLVQRDDTLVYTFDDAEYSRVAGTISRAPLLGRVRVLLENA